MSTPFKVMKAVYVYISALIGLLLVAAGIYAVVEYLLSILFVGAPFDTIYMITPFTRIIVGLFIMVPHWAIGHHFHNLESKKSKK